RSIMSRLAAKITGVAGYVPPRVLTNADLEKMVDTTNDWIMARVGIRERHIVDKGVATSDLAVEAAKKALAQHALPLHCLPGSAQARRSRRLGIRYFRRLLGFHLCRADGSAIRRLRHSQ